MAHPTLAQVVRTIRPAAKAKAASADSDAELLSRFVQSRDEAAFHALVTRHGKTVLSACRQLLSDPADLDDAFQATFLVLLKKAKALAANPSPLTGWLFAVAHRVAVRCRADRHRRSTREAEAARRAATARGQACAAADLSWREAIEVLHEELNALPDKYRLPLLLCGVQGLTRDEAAEHLGTTVGAIRGHLERGRALLEKRLEKRGVVLSVGWLAVVMESARAAGGPSAALIDLAARQAFPPAVAALARGAFPMIPTLKPVAVAVSAVLLAFGLSVALVTPTPTHADEKPALKADKKAESKTDGKPAEKATVRTISGKVLDHGGKPIVAELELVWVDGKPTPLGKAKPDGTFKVTIPMMQGGYGGWLVAKAPGHGPDFLETGFDWQPKTLATTAEVTLKLPKERPIKGRLLDQQGKPVAGAKVVVSTLAAFDSAESITDHMTTWAKENYYRGASPDGDRSMYFPGVRSDLRPNAAPPPYTATSDADGRFTLTGLGADQLVFLDVRGNGVADKDVGLMNRDGFDMERFNKMAKEYEFKGFSFGGRWLMTGPDPTVVLDPEKVIRGRVTGPDGKGRAGVTVAFSRTNRRDLAFGYHVAKTDPDGKYEIRGAKKHKGYGVEVPPDPATGLMQSQAFADDTVGYEPIVIDVKQAKGVVVSGRVTDKATGKPVVCDIYADVMANNPFVEKFPTFMNSASLADATRKTDKDGKFRIVTIPGRVVLSVAPSKGEWNEYKPAVPDPNHKDSFFRTEGTLMFTAYGGGRGFVQGCWCKVLEAKLDDTELTVNAELELAPKTTVKVVDADGKPVTGFLATGIDDVEFNRAREHANDTITVFNLDPKAERLLAVRHEKRNLVGTAKVTADTKDPVVKVDKAGVVTGRAVTPEGKPLAGLDVYLSYTNRVVQEAAGGTMRVVLATDANGEFKFDGVFPGQEFRVAFYKKRQRFGPDSDKTPKHTLAKPGDVLKLGDVKLEPSSNDE